MSSIEAPRRCPRPKAVSLKLLNRPPYWPSRIGEDDDIERVAGRKNRRADEPDGTARLAPRAPGEIGRVGAQDGRLVPRTRHVAGQPGIRSVHLRRRL